MAAAARLSSFSRGFARRPFFFVNSPRAYHVVMRQTVCRCFNLPACSIGARARSCAYAARVGKVTTRRAGRRVSPRESAEERIRASPRESPGPRLPFPPRPPRSSGVSPLSRPPSPVPPALPVEVSLPLPAHRNPFSLRAFAHSRFLVPRLPSSPLDLFFSHSLKPPCPSPFVSLGLSTVYIRPIAPPQ